MIPRRFSKDPQLMRLLTKSPVFVTDTLSSRQPAPNCVSLRDILETKGVDPKYYLSPKACSGILRRAAKRDRTLPPLLLQALQQVAEKSES